MALNYKYCSQQINNRFEFKPSPMTQAVRIAEDLDKLISSLRPSANKQFQLEIHEYFKRLNTSLYRPNTQTPQQLKEKILKKVAEKNDSKTHINCAQTINNILNSTQINKKPELLKFFLKYSQINAASTQSRLFQVEDKITSLNLTQQTTYANSNIHNLSQAHNLSNVQNLSNLSSVSSQPSGFTKPRRQLSAQQLEPLRYRGSLEQGISQIDIIRQISYVMQNVDANLIRVTEQGNYELKANINVSQTVKGIVTELCEVGWLYKKIIFMLRNKGSIEKALAIGVQEEITEYYRWLAIIENGLQMGTLNLRTLASWCREPIEKLKWLGIVLEAAQDFSGCTLISTVNAFRPHGDYPINVLLNNLLGHMIKPLLHFIHNWVYKGQLTDDHKEYFVEEKQKYNEGMEWFERYRLVERNIPNILDKESSKMIFNAGKFRLTEGKTISFLKNRCRCNYSIPIPFIDHEKILSQDIYESSNILSVDFRKWLTAVYDNLSAKLVNELRTQYNLGYHFNSMKCFYLMGKGDFVQHLLDTLVSNAELEKPKHQVYELNLDAYINQALNKCFPDYDIKKHFNPNLKIELEFDKTFKSRLSQANQKIPIQNTQKNNLQNTQKTNLQTSKLSKLKSKKQPVDYDNSYRANILNRLLAKKVDFSETAWDAFNFQYAMDRIEPLNSILTPDLVENYQKIFQFLWKLKRIEYILKSIWLCNTKEYPKTQKSKPYRGFTRVLHRCHVLRTNMTHFVNTFFGYLMIAIESAWDRFSASIEKAKSLDDIIREHRMLHSELASITFGSQNKKSLRDSLMNVFKSIEKFKTTSVQIESEYKNFSQKMRQYENRKKIVAKGYLSVEEGELEIPSFEEEVFGKKMMEIVDVYEQAFRMFFENLKKEGLETGVLVFRLDFSEYFAMKEIEYRA